MADLAEIRTPCTFDGMAFVGQAHICTAAFNPHRHFHYGTVEVPVHPADLMGIAHYMALPDGRGMRVKFHAFEEGFQKGSYIGYFVALGPLGVPANIDEFIGPDGKLKPGLASSPWPSPQIRKPQEDRS